MLSKHDINIEAFHDFDSVEYIWCALECVEGNLCISASFDWARTWWEVFGKREDDTFGRNKRLLILVAMRDGEPVAIAVLVHLTRRKKVASFSFVEFLGQQWGATFLDIIGPGAGPEVTKAVIDWLKQHESFDVLNLAYVPETTTSWDMSGKRVYALSACPIIKTADYADFDSYKNVAYSKSLKQNMRTASNKIDAAGVRIEFISQQVDEAVLAKIHTLSKAKLGDGKQCIYLDEDKARFVALAAVRLNAGVVFVMIDGKPAAYRLNFEFNRARFCVDASYDRSYPKFELGAFSVEASIRDSFNQGLLLHCEGTGVEFYKTKFTKELVGIYRVLIPGNTAKSLLLCAGLARSYAYAGAAFTTEIAGIGK